MKNKLIIYILFFAAVFTACEKTDVAQDLSATVNPTQVVSTINDTLVVYAGQALEFQLSGTPDLLTFYSGEAGRAYANRSRVTAAGTPKMDFSYAPGRVTVDHKVDVLASTDFKGVYDSINIKTAKWDTLTPPDMKAYLNSFTAKPISTIDLSKYGGGQPVFIACRLVVNSSAVNTNPTFSNLLIRNYQNDGIVSDVVNGVAASGMSFVTLSENAKWKLKGSGNAFWRISGVSLTVTVSPFDAATVDPIYNATDGRIHELWAVSKILYLDKTLPDAGVTIKDITQVLANYKYTYAKSGTYTVTFVGATLGTAGVKQTTTKNLILKVIDKPV